MKDLNIGKDYSINPSGRFPSDGPNSGERFREEYLLPALASLQEGEKLRVVLDDGVKGYGSSFLSEGFGGVVRDKHFRASELLSMLEFFYENNDFEFFQNRITAYILEMD